MLISAQINYLLFLMLLVVVKKLSFLGHLSFITNKTHTGCGDKHYKQTHSLKLFTSRSFFFDSIYKDHTANHPVCIASRKLTRGRAREALQKSFRVFQVAAAQVSGLVTRSHHIFDKAKVKIEPSVRKSIWRPECNLRHNLGWKLSPINCLCILNKDLTRFPQSPIFLVELRNCSANRVTAYMRPTLNEYIFSEKLHLC